MKIIPSNVAEIFAVANMRHPVQGSKALAIALDFSADGVLNGSLDRQLSSGEFDIVQSIFIDNSGNSGNLNIQFLGGGSRGMTITAQPYSQGFYPVSAPVGVVNYVATTNAGQVVPIILYNCAMPYFTWGPVPGVLVVPALANTIIELRPSFIGNNVLIAGVLGQTIKVYRMLMAVDAPTNYKLWSGVAGTALTGTIPQFAGGSSLFGPSGVPWFVTQPGQSFIMNTDAAVNIGGVIGYVQS